MHETKLTEYEKLLHGKTVVKKKKLSLIPVHINFPLHSAKFSFLFIRTGWSVQ